ncbi:S8 family serine peptidase [Microbispora sp. NPDC049125]|uniref:S8 family serine peptidase n=1 Tax=Microbispora sp. NPDC049125 TaxID=3154929 RepID=UPI0034662F6B
MPYLPRRSRLIALGAALAALAVTPPAFAGASDTPPGTPAPPNATAGVPRTVTLITGDKVTVSTAPDGTETRSVQSPDGGSAGFHVTKQGADTYLYPDASLPYVGAGLLDKELFNVTRLLADGYDDAHTGHLPLIVTYTDAAARSRTQAVPSGAAKVLNLSSIQGAALAEDRGHAADFWSSLTGGAAARRTTGKPALTGGIAKVWLDGKVKVDLADTTAQIGAPQVWAGGDTGEGVDVAVLDTGIDAEHPDLAGKVADSASFVPDEVIVDRNGHGTHVASTIAGSGAASGGKEKGVAPGARLLVGKVLNSDGSGQDSWVLAGMEWAARDKHARIISMSLGAGPTDGTDPLSQAVNTLSAETGALFTIAAGNAGPHSVGTPGAADAALTVGAVDGSDQLADFSSTGPRWGDLGLKPELTAPGVDVLAARSQYAMEGEGYYQTLSGTSMATPHVAGAAALLAAAHPAWTGAQLKDALVSSTKPAPQNTVSEVGTGRLDVAAAMKSTVFATASAYSGYHAWPHEAGEKDAKEVTYTNMGDTPVTLDLAVDIPNAPKGLFSLSAPNVTVPAHGTAAVTLTADLDLAPLDGYYAGTIDASGADGAIVARTLAGIMKEGERYNLSITAKDRAGKPLGGQLVLIGKKIFAPFQLDESGIGSVRMPKGTYTAWLEADVQGSHGPGSLGYAMLSVPDIDLSRDRAVTLDASAARQVTAVTPKKTTSSALRMEIYRGFGPDDYSWSARLPGPEYDSMWTLPTGKKVTEGEFIFGARWRDEEPALTVASATREFDDLLVRRGATPLPEGRTTLDAVFAGDGAAAALATARPRGQAVVVRRDDAVPVEQQAAAAAAAGARLLIVVNDGVGRLQPWDDSIWYSTEPPPLTVATITHQEGEELISQIQRGRVPLTLESSPTTDYLYDLVHHYDGAIPSDLTYRPDKLARVDVSFRNHRQGKAGEYRLDAWQGYALGNLLLQPAQGDRTDWVSADQDTQWLEQAMIPGEVSQLSPPERYKAGSTTALDWFGPIHRPRLGANSAIRQDDMIAAFVPGWSDSGSDHVGTTFGNWQVKNAVSLYQGDTLLGHSDIDQFSVAGLSPSRLPYRLVSENSRGDWANPYSTGTRTEWGFTSAAGDPGAVAALPLIQLDYDVDTDAAGLARRNADVTITPSHLPGGPSSASIKAVTLDVSYDDGATWQKASVAHRDGRWTVKLHAPVNAGFVSLRTTARDDAGDSVTQSITRAFGLR